jgi:hypothetical protein
VKPAAGGAKQRGKWNQKWNMQTKNANQAGGQKKRVKVLKKTNGWRRAGVGGASSMLVGGASNRQLQANRWQTSSLQRAAVGGGQRVGLQSMGLNRNILKVNTGGGGVGVKRVVKKNGVVAGAAGSTRKVAGSGLRFVNGGANKKKAGAVVKQIKRIGIAPLKMNLHPRPRTNMKVINKKSSKSSSNSSSSSSNTQKQTKVQKQAVPQHG